MAPVTKLKAQATTTKPAQGKLTLNQRVDLVVKTITSITAINSAQTSVHASAALADAAKLKREIEAEYKRRREPHVKAQREIIAEEKSFTTKLDQAVQNVAKMIRAFQQKEAAERAAKEAAERKRREDEARAEAQLRADQLRAAAATSSKTVAKRLEAQADMIANAQPVIDPIVIEDAPRTLAAGVHSRNNVHAAVDNATALMLQVAAGVMLKQYGGANDPHIAAFLSVFKPNAQATADLVMPCMPKLNKLANAFPSDLELEGVRVENDESFVAR